MITGLSIGLTIVEGSLKSVQSAIGAMCTSERGVNVSHELYPETDDDRLRRLSFRGGLVDIEGTSRTYLLDVSRVDAAELRIARRVLTRMNYDGRFQLDLE